MRALSPWLALRLGAISLGSALVVLLVFDGEWPRYVALALGVVGALLVLKAVGPPRDGGRRAGPFLD